MPLEFSHESLVLRVGGDILEILIRGAFSHRVPLAWVAVQVQPAIKGHLDGTDSVGALRRATVRGAAEGQERAGNGRGASHQDRG